MKKKLFSFLLAACMVLGMLPTMALAAEEALTLNPSTAELKKGEQVTITATVPAGSQDSVYWTSSDTALIISGDKVKTDGGKTYTVAGDTHVITVTTQSEPEANTTATVTATLGDNGSSVTCTLTILAKEPEVVEPETPTAEITLEPAKAELAKGETVELTATVANGGADSVYWVSGDATLLKISGDKVKTDGGKTYTAAEDAHVITVTALKAPEKDTPVTVTATLGSGADAVKAECVVTVLAPLTVEAPVITPAGGEYKVAPQVSITCATEGAVIYYSVVTEGVEGSAAEEASFQQYEEPFTLDNGTHTVTAYAVLGTGEAQVKSEKVTETYVVDVEFVVGEPEVDEEALEAATEGLSPEDAQTVAATAKSVKVDIPSDTIQTVTEDAGYKAVQEKAAAYKEKTPEELKALIVDADGALISGTADPAVVIQVVVKTTPKKGGYIKGESISLDIGLWARVVATYDSDHIQIGLNSAVLADTETKVSVKADPEAVNPIEVSIAIPEDIVAADATTAWVKHDHNGTLKLHKANKKGNAFTFINKWGFSEFTVDKTAPCVAVIEGDENEALYASLQDAVDKAESGAAILILDNTDASKLTATVKAYGVTTLTIKADGGYLAVDADLSGVVIKNRKGEAVTPEDGVYTIDNGKAPSGGHNRYSSNGTGEGSNVTITSAAGGKVTISPAYPTKDRTVTLNVTPDEGYVLESLTVKDSKGNVVALTKVNESKYTFTMPSGTVTVTPVFVKISESVVPFTDVADDAYYHDAVLWAVAKDITKGTGDGLFSPNMVCTRAQMVTFLWRAAGCPDTKSSTNPFSDVSSDAYYYDAVLWAVEAGVTKGTGDGFFSPDVTVSRSQTVTFLYRAAGSPAVSASGSFTDVPADAYYTTAVQWALDRGVTKGTGNGLFSPEAPCTRAEIVTFLYRDRVK